MPSTAPAVGSYVVELVVDVRGPMPVAEVALRAVRADIGALSDRSHGHYATLISQEFGRLTCTVRAVLEAGELLEATEQAVRAVRPILLGAHDPALDLVFAETSLHSRPL
ncbi:MAG: hypothetical protein ACXVFV_03375 [Mycobacteriales bacterium]